MNQGAVVNNNLGVVFKGANLRNHTFSWTLTPTDNDEQHDIENIVKHIKRAAMPGMTDAWGDDSSVASIEAAIAKLDAQRARDVKEGRGPSTDVKIAQQQEALAEAKMALAGGSQKVENITTLTIPYTVGITFYQSVGGKYVENSHLPKIGDSFMTDVTVSYSTQAGGYSAYQDGAALNTKLGLNLKEILPMTQQSIKKGY